MKVVQIAIAVAAFAFLLTEQTAMDLTPYGIAPPTNASCGDIGVEGYRIDRQFASQCFVRQVYCDENDVLNETLTRTCDSIDEVYEMDENNTCVDKQMAACALSIDCGETSISVHVGYEAIWNQTDASLQFGESSGHCYIHYNDTTKSYDGSMSLLDNMWETCGTTRELVEIDGQVAIKYYFKVGRSVDRSGEQRMQEKHGATVTREKHFLLDASCYYKADGTASSSYRPTAAGALTKSDESVLEFEMYPTDCEGTRTSTQSVYVNEKVCFETAIKSYWHKDIRISTTSCWATPNADDNVKYELDKDTTFDWDCYRDAHHEKFSFMSFRFQNASNNSMNDLWNDQTQYVQTINIHCDVNACEKDDDHSADCALHSGCSLPGSRRRRALSDDMSVISKFTKSKASSKLYLINAERPTMVTYDSPRYSLVSDTLSVAMFVSGCVFGIVAIGLLIVMKRTKNQMLFKVLSAE